MANKKVVISILLVSAVLLSVVSFLVSDKSLKWGLLSVGTASLLGVILLGILGKGFGYKSTLEEIEEKQFGKK